VLFAGTELTTGGYISVPAVCFSTRWKHWCTRETSTSGMLSCRLFQCMLNAALQLLKRLTVIHRSVFVKCWYRKWHITKTGPKRIHHAGHDGFMPSLIRSFVLDPSAEFFGKIWLTLKNGSIFS